MVLVLTVADSFTNFSEGVQSQDSRNLMYLGFLVTLLGWALFLSNASAFLLLPAFVLYMNRIQICPEERALISLSGEDYEEYYARVRR